MGNNTNKNHHWKGLLLSEDVRKVVWIRIKGLVWKTFNSHVKSLWSDSAVNLILFGVYFKWYTFEILNNFLSLTFSKEFSGAESGSQAIIELRWEVVMLRKMFGEN